MDCYRLQLSDSEHTCIGGGAIGIYPDPITRGDDTDEVWNAAVDGFVTTVLALHCAGLDLRPFEKALAGAWESIGNAHA